MEDPAGVMASIINAVLFFFISLYIVFIKRNKDPSHYFFLFMTISISLYGLSEIFKYSESYQVALHLSRISLILLSIALYFFALFTYYLRIGINKEVPIFLLFITIFTVGIAIGPLIEDVQPSAYGWIPVFNDLYLSLYVFSLYLYLLLGIYNLIVVHQNIDRFFKKKILYLIIGALIVLGATIIQSINAVLGIFFPLVDLSFFISGIIYFYTLIK